MNELSMFVDWIEADAEGKPGDVEDEGNVGSRLPREKQER